MLIRVHAAGIDRGTWHLMAGQPYAVRLAIGLRRPRNPVPGLDVAGTVVAAGPAVSRFAVGDEVFGISRGSFAEYAAARECRRDPPTNPLSQPEAPMRTVTSAIELNAPPEAIWQVLTDTAAHSDWNPFITELHGNLEVGNRIDVRIAPPGGRPMSFHPTVTEVEPGRKLAWLGHLLFPGLFDGAHSFNLEPLSDGRTRLVQSETFRGVLVGFSGHLLHNTEAGFTAMKEALRRQVTERNPA